MSPYKTVFNEWKDIKIPYKILLFSPGWCGSVDSVPACELKGHQFNSQSGHMPRL